MAESLRIKPDDAKAMIDAGEAIVLDVVAPASWMRLDRSIPAAVRIPPNEVDARWQELPRDRAIVAYCT